MIANASAMTVDQLSETMKLAMLVISAYSSLWSSTSTAKGTAMAASRDYFFLCVAKNYNDNSRQQRQQATTIAQYRHY